MRIHTTQQPVIEFSSSSTCAQPSVAMQDSNVICLHQDDVGNSACILAVEGYGEVNESNDSAQTRIPILEDADSPATVRGARTWRETVGGATICCSQCCSPLGFASIESPATYRLLKHRLSIESSQKGKYSRPVSTCASFLARELVRYAEAKAIFTFVVGIEQSGSNSNNNAAHKRCLLLRLLSWDSIVATKFETPEPAATSGRVRFERVAKIVYEETFDKTADDDITNWVWGGVDLCCPPQNENPNDERTPRSIDSLEADRISTVRLHLHRDEYNEVRQNLAKGSNFFSKSVVEATIMIKMGSSVVGGDLGLSVIPLSL
jgi:hypothetical protein